MLCFSVSIQSWAKKYAPGCENFSNSSNKNHQTCIAEAARGLPFTPSPPPCRPCSSGRARGGRGRRGGAEATAAAARTSPAASPPGSPLEFHERGRRFMIKESREVAQSSKCHRPISQQRVFSFRAAAMVCELFPPLPVSLNTIWRDLGTTLEAQPWGDVSNRWFRCSCCVRT